MKTYRLYSLRILTGHQNGFTQQDIPIEEGLIINMDDTGKKWLVDAVTEKDQKHFFEEITKENDTLLIEVVITRPNNNPATMVAKIRKITELSSKLSVLIDGLMVVQKEDIVELILQGIVREGISGEKLLHEYKKRKADRSESIQRIIKQVENDEYQFKKNLDK